MAWLKRVVAPCRWLAVAPAEILPCCCATALGYKEPALPRIEPQHSIGRRECSSAASAQNALSDEQLAIRSLARDFARERLAPSSSRWDREEVFPVEELREAAALGFAGMFITEEYGGTALSRADAAAVFEELAYGDVAAAAYLTIHSMVGGVISRFGSAQLKERYLPRLADMSSLASYCLTEPGSGSDAASLSTLAQPVDGGSSYLISGSKAFISGAGAADVYLVMARVAGGGGAGGGGSSSSGAAGEITAFIVDKELPGVSFGSPEHKLGWRCQPTATVNLDSVRVPAENILGQTGQGFAYAMAALDGGRINIAACSIGGAAFCLDYAWQYANSRQQFGMAVGDFQHNQFKLADMATSIQAARLMVEDAARALDARRADATLVAAMAKRFATDACFGVANDALQLLGGYGYLQDYPIEQKLRDLRVHSILEGTNEIMRVVIHRQLRKLRYA